MKEKSDDNKKEQCGSSESGRGICSTFTHQFRTPLTAITGYVSLLRDGAFGDLSNEQREIVRIISKNLYRVNLLLDDFKDLQYIESGTITLSRSLVTLEDLLKPVLREIKMAAEEKNIKFVVDGIQKMNVFVDVGAIRRAFLHILLNSVQYTGSGEVRLEARQEGTETIIMIVDSGVGIEARDMRNLFRKYYRSAHPAIRENPGAGLGLFIARALIESGGGTIGIQSEQGKGTTVTLSLPSVPS